MDITFLGHAGLYLETRHGSILCDPWFHPAYFASWFPFPSNERIDRGQLRNPTYLYISHLHHDHYDPQFLREEVSKETTVLLPDYPLGLLERALRGLGFTKFIHTKNGQVLELGGLRVMILAMIAPIDGSLGDSGLLVDDGEVRVFNQNDSRPIDINLLTQYGPYDVHFVQFSGAIWYPMVYQFPEKMLQALGRKKRENAITRALRYIQEIDATYVVPSAGPPCFLDDHLFAYNDFERTETNTFPDQTVFLDYLREQGREGGRLMIPGTRSTLTREGFTLQHPFPDDEVAAIFIHKRSYLEAYRRRQWPVIQAQKAAWPRRQVDILACLKVWLEPLLEQADLTAVGINGRVLLDCDVQQIVLDFHTRQVYSWQNEEWDYRFHIDHALVEYCIVHQEEDWVNQIFLSCRFEAERKGAYNEYLYTFFQCLSPERLHYAEGYYAEKSLEKQLWESHGYRIQRRCPHLKADLARFSSIEGDVLTCTLHGWQFDLVTGRCLTSEGHPLYTQPVSEPEVEHLLVRNSTSGQIDTIRTKCDHCWYKATDIKSSRSKTQGL
jgi:UDP-MurNAc hydroxylase